MESKNSENRNSGTVYNHTSGVRAQSRKLPSNGPKAALMLIAIAISNFGGAY